MGGNAMRGNGDMTLTERLLAAQRPRPWATLSSVERSAQMDAFIAQLRDVTAQHNALARLVVAQNETLASLEQQQGATFASLCEFCGRAWRARLRWLVTGR